MRVAAGSKEVRTEALATVQVRGNGFIKDNIGGTDDNPS